MAFYRSEIINITRYKNATFVKLVASASGFVSYDFEPEDGSGTFTPEEITIRATYGGNLVFRRWEYSLNGETWSRLEYGQAGITFDTLSLTIPASCSLFSNTNCALTIRCVAGDPEQYDAVTITREVDPLQVYRKSSAGISNLADKISLIATDEQLRQFTAAETFYSKYAEFSVGMGEFKQEVVGTYATKEYADGAAGAAEANAKDYADRYFITSSVYNTKMQQTDTAISTQAAAITGLAGDVAAKATVFSQGTAPASGMTDGDLWVDTANNNEVYRYQSTGENPGWKPVINASAIVSQINQTAEQIAISGNKINLSGLVTANENFKILNDGSIQAKNADLSGIINVGGNSGGAINIFDSTNTKAAEITSNGFTFFSNGVSRWRGTSNYTRSGTTKTIDKELGITDGALVIYSGNWANPTTKNSIMMLGNTYDEVGYPMASITFNRNNQFMIGALNLSNHSYKPVVKIKGAFTTGFSNPVWVNASLKTEGMLLSTTRGYPVNIYGGDSGGGGYFMMGCLVFVNISFTLDASWTNFSSYKCADGFPEHAPGNGTYSDYSGMRVTPLSTNLTNGSATINRNGELTISGKRNGTWIQVWGIYPTEIDPDNYGGYEV